MKKTKKLTRGQLRRFWDRVLRDLRAGRPFSQKRFELVVIRARHWET